MDEKVLVDQIMLRIGREARRRLAMKATAFCAVLVGSTALAAYGFRTMVAGASHSGFFLFSSLLFTDFSAAAASFSDFAFSLLESFPLVPALLLLSGIFFAIWSAARFAHEIASLRRHAFNQ